MDKASFYTAVRGNFGSLSQKQVDCIEAILDAWAIYGDGDVNKLAYLLSTAFHETGRFKWLKEIWGPTAAQKRYEGRADLGNTVKGDGKRFMGRGLVHITGRRNYADWSKRLGIDLVAKPEMAEQLDIAARILVQGTMLGTFTGKKLADYINAAKVDFVNARRTINGTDKADLIAGYARKFLAALDTTSAQSRPPEPAPQASPPQPAPAKPKSPLAAVVAIIIGIAAAAYAFLKAHGVAP